jgi:hypothetical protein
MQSKASMRDPKQTIKPILLNVRTVLKNKVYTECVPETVS